MLEWWFPTTLTVEGTITDFEYDGYTHENFAGHFNGNTELDFTVEIWDETKSTLLASDSTVENEPIKADDFGSGEHRYTFTTTGFQHSFFTVQNVGNSDADIDVTLRDTDGKIIHTDETTLPQDNAICSWDELGDLYNYGDPVVTNIASDVPLAVECGNWGPGRGSAWTVWRDTQGPSSR